MFKKECARACSVSALRESCLQRTPTLGTYSCCITFTLYISQRGIPSEVAMWLSTSTTIRSLLDPYKAGARPGETVSPQGTSRRHLVAMALVVSCPPFIHLSNYDDNSSTLNDVLGLRSLQHRTRDRTPTVSSLVISCLSAKGGRGWPPGGSNTYEYDKSYFTQSTSPFRNTGRPRWMT